jgi:hypothetical protein
MIRPSRIVPVPDRRPGSSLKPLVSVVSPQNNTIIASVTQVGFFYIGPRLLLLAIFADGFETSPP